MASPPSAEEEGTNLTGRLRSRNRTQATGTGAAAARTRAARRSPRGAPFADLAQRYQDESGANDASGSGAAHRPHLRRLPDPRWNREPQTQGPEVPAASRHATTATDIRSGLTMRPVLALPTGPTSVAYLIPAGTGSHKPKVRRFPLPLVTLRPQPGTSNDFL